MRGAITPLPHLPSRRERENDLYYVTYLQITERNVKIGFKCLVMPIELAP
jgi:hypothetical protein